jgi:hypothetical protein
MSNKKYKLILLKDLPNYKAGTTVLNISQEELDGTKDYKYRHYVPEMNFSKIYDLRNNAEWVKIEEDDRCDCFTKDHISISDETIGYGRHLSVGLSFVNKEIYSYYDYACDSGTTKKLPIKFCPLCGRGLNAEDKAESEG